MSQSRCKLGGGGAGGGGAGGGGGGADVGINTKPQMMHQSEEKSS